MDYKIYQNIKSIKDKWKSAKKNDSDIERFKKRIDKKY